MVSFRPSLLTSERMYDCFKECMIALHRVFDIIALNFENLYLLIYILIN